jgi:hypothetical protein
MHKLHPCPITVNGMKKVIFLSPNNSCWQCEQELPPEPSAVARTVPTRQGLVDSVYLVCSEDCERALTPELTWPGLTPRSVEPTEVTALLQRPENIVGIIEGWQGQDRPWYLFWGPFFDRETEPQRAFHEVARVICIRKM